MASVRATERAELDRDVGARNRAEMIGFQQWIGRPLANGGGQRLDQVEIAALIGFGLRMAHARFAQQIDAEGHAFAPKSLQRRQGGGDVRAGDEIVRDRGDPPGNGLGHEPFGQPAGLQSEVHARRQCDARLAEVLRQVLMDLFGRAEHREDVDKAEQLHLEGRVLHRPVHELIRPEAGGEQPRAMLAGGMQKLAADLRCAALMSDEPAGAREVLAGVSGEVSRLSALNHRIAKTSGLECVWPCFYRVAAAG